MNFPLYYGYLTTEEIDDNAGVWTRELYPTAKKRAKAMQKKVERFHKEWGISRLPSWNLNGDWLVFKFRSGDRNPPKIIRTYEVGDIVSARRDFRIEVWLLKPDPSKNSKSYTQYYFAEFKHLTEFEAKDIRDSYSNRYGDGYSSHLMRVSILGRGQHAPEEYTDLRISASQYEELFFEKDIADTLGRTYTGL